MKVIGITGASGSGKTTISQILQKRKHTKIIDADKMVRQMTNFETEYFSEVKKAFEEEKIVYEDGTLNRAKLASLIYRNEEDLKKLNCITFEHLIPKIVNEIKHVPKDTEIVIMDAPLLFEAGLDQYCDCTVALYVPDEVKINRICKRDSISEKIAKERLSIQKDNAFYQQKSDYVIVNDENTSLQDLEERICEIIEKELTLHM